jgi:hypothetical protein
MCRGTLSTARSPSAARCSFTVSRNKSFQLRSLWAQSNRFTTPGSDCRRLTKRGTHVDRITGGGCACDGSVPAQNAA